MGGKARVCVRAPKNGRREAGRAHLLKAEDVFLPVPDFITKKPVACLLITKICTQPATKLVKITNSEIKDIGTSGWLDINSV